MVHAPSKKAASRQRSEDRLTKIKQRDVDVMDHQRRIHEAETAKLIRLRGLRLAKEAADREAEAHAEPRLSPGPKLKRVRRATSKIGVTESEV